MKKALNNADPFTGGNSIPTRRDSRTSTSYVIDYIISSPRTATTLNIFP